MTQQKIISGIRNRDEQAIRDLVEEYQNYVFTISMRIVRNSEMAEEIAHDVFIKVINKIHTFKADSKFTTWLFTIVYRTSLNYLNKVK